MTESLGIGLMGEVWFRGCMKSLLYCCFLLMSFKNVFLDAIQELTARLNQSIPIEKSTPSN